MISTVVTVLVLLGLAAAVLIGVSRVFIAISARLSKISSPRSAKRRAVPEPTLAEILARDRSRNARATKPPRRGTAHVATSLPPPANEPVAIVAPPASSRADSPTHVATPATSAKESATELHNEKAQFREKFHAALGVVMSQHEAVVLPQRQDEPQQGDKLRIDSRTAPRWVPFGKDVLWGSVTIAGGGYYIGRPTAASQRHPSLFDPSLRFDFKNPDWTGQTMPYWPQYADISERARGAFVGFLNSPRNASIGIGHVFLYLYGLERRLLVDAIADDAARTEVPVILAELRRLVTVYGPSSGSIQRYLPALINATTAIFVPDDGKVPGPPEIAPIEFDAMTLRALGRINAQRQPLPAGWALTWARILTPVAHSSTWDCVWPEARSLFNLRYASAYPKGLVVPAARSKLKVRYRWAAIGNRESEFELGVPDVSGIVAPVRPLSALLATVLNALEPLRKIRRSKTRTPIAEVIALPEELRGAQVPPELAALNAAVRAALTDKPVAPFAIADLVRGFGLDTRKKPGKRDATLLATGLEALNIGMEPDVRFGAPALEADGTAVLFRLSSGAVRAPSAAYGAALVLVQAGLLVAGDDGMTATEVDAAVRAIEEQFELAPSERERMSAHIELLKRSPPKLNRVESIVRLLPESDRQAFAHVLLDIAAADGQITPGEVRLLERFYKALQLDPARVHADLHHAATGHRRRPAAASGSVHVLDQDAIAAKLAETARVQAALAQIFVEEAPTVPPPVAPQVAGSPSAARGPVVDGLDADGVALLVQLLAGDRGEIPRAELEAICESAGLPVEGALESLNEAAFTHAGEALLEGDDPLEFNPHARDTLRDLVHRNPSGASA